MGQRDTEHRPRRRRLPEPLEVRLPPLFRCPISLEVMRSPVSLCTGVTYDRSSIQRWLDSGHRTCPATRLPLPSTLLVPNLALRGLILSSAAAEEDDGGGGRSETSAAEIASRIAAAAEEGGDPEAAVRVLALMLGSDRVGKGDDKESAIAALVADLDRSVPALLAVVRGGRGIGPRIDAVRVLEAILASPARVCGEESKAAIAEREELFPELVRIMGDGEAAEAEAAIGCMAAAAAAAGKRRAARARMVGAGAVAALARAIAAAEVSAAAAEQGMALVGAAAGCAEGRVAIAGDAAAVVGALMGRITRVGAVGREAAVAALWAVCCGGGSSGGGGDKRAREAMLAVPGGLGKLLEVMQRECSPAAARMAGDLLRIYTAGAVKNGDLGGFDSKTIHVMPY